MGLQVYTLSLISIAQVFLLASLVLVLWLPSPDRDMWAFLLFPAAVISLASMHLNRRFYGQSRFYFVVAAFIVLCILSIYTSPFQSRGWVLLFRPLAGVWILATLTEISLSAYSKRWISLLSALVTLVILLMGLGGLNWTGKASRFSDFTALLPQWQSFWWWRGGLNVNEYSGGAVWLLSVLAGLAVRLSGNTVLRIASGAAASILAVIVFLTQSLSGIAGVVAGLIFIFVPQRYFRLSLIAAGLILLTGNLAVLLFPVQSANLLAEVSGRPDVNSLEHRAVMWQRAQAMIYNHPFTGVGIAMYRQLREEYTTPGYERFLVPHPHNEALQFGTDLGLPGLIVYGWLALTVAQAAYHVVTHGSKAERAAALALTAGLFSHAVYALTDAIPIWDRFAFLFWWLLGLLSGLDARVSARRSAPAPDKLTSA
jgi:O-antigen ligase